MSAQTQIQIPSKYDIIPIHTSDRTVFKTCRRKWNWSSPARQNLTRKVSVYGVYEPFWFGTGIHHAIQKYYDPSYQEDITVAWETWFNQQVNGGYITEDELEEYVDRQPVLKENGLYWVDGLSDLLMNFDADKFAEFKELGTGMTKYYAEYAQANDNFTVIAVEQTFSIPITDEQGNPIYAVDTRQMPDGWEFSALYTDRLPEVNILGPVWRIVDTDPLVVEKQVHARGRIDIIVQDNESGRYGLRDWKTTSRLDDDYFRHLDLDEQVTTYCFAGEVLANLYDLPYKKIDFIDYVGLLKAYPKPPTVNKRGTPFILSISRTTESTTAEMFAEAVDLIPGARTMFDMSPEAQNYYTWLLETEDTRFINTTRVRRNKWQKYNCGRRLFFEAQDMLNKELAIYPNPTKNYDCLNCWFRSPCVMAEDGGDYKTLLADGFVKNYDR